MTLPAQTVIPSPVELQARLRAQRDEIPFLAFRDALRREVILPLPATDIPLVVGRGASCGLRLEWDEKISRVHVEIVCVGDERAVVDDGLSRNGSFVNGERVQTRRRLRSGDVLSVGQTNLLYWAPEPLSQRSTAMASQVQAVAALSPAQRRVLVALARPCLQSTGFPTPATNQAIASELFISVDGVKSHLRALAQKFGVRDLPQNQKRARLVERALMSGVISAQDLETRPPR